MRVVRPLLIPIALFSAARRRTRFRAVGCGRRRPAAGVGLDDAGGPSGDDAARARWDDVPRRAMRLCRGARRPRLNVRIVDQYTGEIYSRLILSRPVLLGRAAPGDTDSIPAGDVVRLSDAAYRDRRADDDGEGRPAVSAMLHVVGAIAPDAFGRIFPELAAATTAIARLRDDELPEGFDKIDRVVGMRRRAEHLHDDLRRELDWRFVPVVVFVLSVFAVFFVFVSFLFTMPFLSSFPCSSCSRPSAGGAPPSRTPHRAAPPSPNPPDLGCSRGWRPRPPRR